MIELVEYEDNVLTVDNLGEKLHRLRTMRGLSLTEVGRRSQISYTTLDKLERGSRIPNMFTVISVAEVFGYELILREKR